MSHITTSNMTSSCSILGRSFATMILCSVVSNGSDHIVIKQFIVSEARCHCHGSMSYGFNMIKIMIPFDRSEIEADSLCKGHLASIVYSAC